MKKSVIMKLGVVVFAAVLLSGCQIGPTDEKLVKLTMSDWKASLIAQDLDKLMETYSEDYKSIRGGDKEATRDFMGRAFNEGWVDNIAVDLENAEMKIEENKAEFAPVELVTGSWDATIGFTLQKEKKLWLIVGSETDRY